MFLAASRMVTSAKPLCSRALSLATSNPAKYAIAFDIDGVLLRGKTVIPGAPEALSLLAEHRVPYVLMTNGGGSLEKIKADAVSHALGVHISPSQVILSHTPMRRLADTYRCAR